MDKSKNKEERINAIKAYAEEKRIKEDQEREVVVRKLREMKFKIEQLIETNLALEENNIFLIKTRDFVIPLLSQCNEEHSRISISTQCWCLRFSYSDDLEKKNNEESLYFSLQFKYDSFQNRYSEVYVSRICSEIGSSLDNESDMANFVSNKRVPFLADVFLNTFDTYEKAFYDEVDRLIGFKEETRSGNPLTAGHPCSIAYANTMSKEDMDCLEDRY